jgi:WD40 repeat protein
MGRPVRVASGTSFSQIHPTSDGRLLYADSETTYAIDAETLHVLRRYPVGAFTTSLSPDGTTLALGGEDGTVRLLDLASGRVGRVRGRHDAAVTSEAFSPDGRTLATGGDDGTVMVWDLKQAAAADLGLPGSAEGAPGAPRRSAPPAQGRVSETLEGHTGAVWGAAFAPDGRTLYTASDDSSVIIWDVAGDRRLGRPFGTGIVQARCRAGTESCGDAYPPAFALSPDGGTLAAARLDGKVDLIDAETLEKSGSFEAFRDTPATAIEYSPDGERLAVGGGRGLLGIWDARSGRRLGPLLYAPRGGPCADPGSMFESARCFNATIQHALAFDPGGGLLASSSSGGKVRIWDLDDRRPIRPPLQVPHYVLGLDFSPDGSQLAIPFGFNNPEGGDGVDILDVESGERVTRLEADSEVRVVAFSPDGRLLATGHIDRRAQLWATDDWRRVGPPLPVDGAFVLWVAFSPDGRTLATTSDNGTVGLWDVVSQALIGSPLPAGSTEALETGPTTRFAPDSSRLFAVYDDGSAIRWEVDPDVWRQRACAIAGGGLTPDEWEEVVPEQDYIEVCPSGEGS